MASDGSGGTGALRSRAAQQRRDGDRHGRGDFGRRAVVRQRRKAHAQALDRGSARRRRQPIVEPGKGAHAAGAQLRHDVRAREAFARKALPQERDRPFISVPCGQLADRMAAHPDEAVLAVRMAEHGLRRHHAFEAVAHALRSLISRTIAARNSGMPAPVRAEVASTSG